MVFQCGAEPPIRSCPVDRKDREQTAVLLFDEEAKLADQGGGDSKLALGKYGSGELAEAYDSYPELGNIEDSHTELSDGDDSLRRNRHPIGPVKEM